ncbi:uncharacterized protein LOC131012257 [Salvia miltiorrhiza]|uniref:uncharacterized protein LOC131012257 n=1 Tax=Salvia miltiorrhiza TaxID=226208 RepID=UPI0025AB99EF|nr:uncharacterized protein LOC131012257 [Salvia miltiorrhiza]XP_057796146.1 uncharacterized protein LOC131012257 [Salvia miltiorrhiza]
MQGGFSIREYASRMRSINVVKCWPFDETLSEETVKSLLPPIVVKRFTWWLDELEYLSSETAEKLTIFEKKTNKVSEKGETSSINAGRDLEDTEEGVKEVKLKSFKGKMRATKKRSILEIFAVAPPVKRAISGEEEGEDNDDDDNVGINRAPKRKRKKKKKLKNTDAILKKALRAVKKIKRKKAAAAAEKRGGEISDKDNCFKLKPRTQEKATGNSSLSCSNEVANDIRHFLSIPKRKGPYKKLVPCKSSKLIEENQHPELPVRSILKNRNSELSPKQSKKCILQEAVQLNNCVAQKGNKHVTFSENGEVLRLSRKPSQSVECSALQKDCGSDTGNVDYAVAVGKDLTVSETSGSEDASTRTGKELGAGPAIDEQLARFSVDSTTIGKQVYEGEYSSRSGSSDRRAMCNTNHYWSDHGLADATHNTKDVCSPRFLHMPRDGYYNNPNMKVITTSSNGTCRRLNKDTGTPCPIFPPLCFEDYLRTHNDAAMSHPSNMRGAYKLSQASPECTAVDCAHSIHFQTFPHLSPNELLQTFCSLPDGSQTGDVRGRSTNGINEEFVGLPLNSQGELIAWNSSATMEGNRMMNSNVNAAPCIGLSLPSNVVSKCSGHHSECRELDSRTTSTGQLNLFPVESYVKENAMSVLHSRLGIIESQSEKENLDLDFLETNYHPFHSPVKTICRGDNQVQKGPENEKFQSTMRLMGKEFEVGGRGIQGFEDGRMWKDKQIIDERHFRNDQNEPSFRQLRETLFYPSETTVNHRSESKYPLPHFDSQTSSTYKSMFLTRTVDCAQKLYPGGLSPGTFSEVYNCKSLFSEPYATGYDSQLFTLELPMATAPHQEFRSESPSVTQLKNKQNLQYSPTSSIKFPFMHPDLDGNANSSWSRRSSLVQHPLRFDDSEKATQLSNSQSCNLGRNHLYLNPGTSCGINGSVSFPPDDFCMFNPLPSDSALQSVAPAPLAPVPYYSGLLPVSAMQRKLENHNKLKERIKSRIGVRGLDIGKKLNAPFKPFKRPILGFHEGHQRAIRKPAACVGFEDTVTYTEGAAFEPCSAAKNPRFMMSGEYDLTNNDGQTILPWSDSYIETARTGPIRLTAGAKHVLKPRQQKDHSSTRATDQDISLSATNVGFRFSDSENSAQMFRF